MDPGNNNAPTQVAGLMSEAEIVDYLKTEAEHFYRAELQSEQRASWLLTLAFGALALVLNCFISLSDHKIRPETAPYLSICALLFFVTVIASVFALWPLQGRGGRLQMPYFRERSAAPDLSKSTPLDVWAKHYLAHRSRAEKKAARVSQTLIVLTLSCLIAGLAIAKNSGLY